MDTLSTILRRCVNSTIVMVGFSGYVLSVYPENLLQQIGWKGATSDRMLWLVVVFLAIITMLIGFHIKTQLHSKVDRNNISKKAYNDLCVKTGLSSSEKEMLERLLRHEFIPYRHAIFQSGSLFEQCVDAEVKLMLLTNRNAQVLDEEEAALSGLRKKMGYGYLPFEHPLLSTRNIEIGQRVSVFPVNAKIPLVDRGIVAVNKETFFRIQYTKENGNTSSFYPGQIINVAFARRGDGVYGVRTEIGDVEKEFAFNCLHTLTFHRNQLRQFVRISVNLPMKVRCLTPKEEKRSSGLVDVNLSDISGGGLSFNCNVPFVPGDRLSMQFTLATGGFSGIVGKVLRVTLVEGTSEPVYRHHVQFVSIEPGQRERVVKYIFEKQRQQNQIR